MIRIDKVATIARLHRLFFIKKVHFIDTFSWKEHLSSGKKTLLVINHGPPHGPLAFFCSMVPFIDDLGFGNITFSGVPHPVLYRLPGLFRQFKLPVKKRGRYSVDDYVKAFKQHDLDALVVAPEGEYCLYGNGIDIQPFRSPRSIEIALRADCEIILAMGKGFEIWQKNISIESPLRKIAIRTLALPPAPFLKLDTEQLEKADNFSLQMHPRRIKNFYIYSKKYKPILKPEELSEHEEEKREQLRVEAERMRGEMQSMVDELKEKYG